MTKKQNRVRGFGRRSLSVVLAVLMLLSTMAVMLTSTMLTAFADDIECWYVVGPFNDWQPKDEFKLSKSGNQWQNEHIPPVVANSPFKLIARQNGNNYWNGLSTGITNQVPLGGNTTLTWENNGYPATNEIHLYSANGYSTDNPEYMKFYVYPNDSGGNNFSVTSSAWNTAGNNHGGNVYTAPAAVAPGNTDTEDGKTIFWAKATYYDYLSDWEHDVTSWLKPIKAGTGFNWSNDDWYPFYGFNRSVVKPYADNGWSTPLYFGNFCYTYDNTGHAYSTSGHHPGTSAGETNNGFMDATNSNNVTNFKYAVNNSNKENKNDSRGGQGLNNYYQSYQNLMYSSLGENGKLLLPDGQTEAPYFNSAALGTYANTVNSAFPFRVTDNGLYKTYEFNSTGGTDNVYFGWENDSSKSSAKPTSVHYGGSSYAVSDGISHFMSNSSSGKGIFPFNGGTGTKTNTNENLDYGFGVKMEVQFRVPKPNSSSGVNTASNPITFEFSGDDDLWMYITDNETGESFLVLDMGGNHKKSTGKVDFNSLTCKVDHVYQGNNTSDASVTKSFSELGLDFDYTKTYTMTVFYMERGLIESNCHMAFSMYPAGNQVNVEKEVNTANLNRTANSTQLQDEVESIDSFDFTAYQADSASGTNTAMKGTEYMDNAYGNRKTNTSTGVFPLRNNEEASFLSQYTTNKYVQIAETNPNNNSYLSYSTTWTVSDPLDSSRNTEGSGLSASKLQLKNPSGEDYDYAQLDYKFINTPQTGSVSITKTVDSTAAADLSKEFNAKVEISLMGANGTFRAYPLTYTASDKSGTFETSSNGQLSSNALLKNGRTITFENLPTNAVVRVTEQLSTTESAAYTCTYPNSNTVTVPNGSTGSISVKNTPITPDAITGSVEGTKQLDGKPYTGDMFQFILEGVPRFSGDASNIIDTSSTELSTTDVTNSTFSFNNLSFDAPGVYRYHVYEDTSYCPTTTTDNSFDTDFGHADTDFLVAITVSKGTDNKLKIDSTEYYSYSRYDDATQAVEHTMSSADFDPSKAVDAIVIKNTVNTGSLVINKENEQGDKVSGVTFAVFKVDDEIDLILSGHTSDAQKYDSIIMHTKLSDEELEVGRDTTGNTGVANIGEIPIYKDNFIKTTTTGGSGLTVNTTDFTGYQKYILLEIDGPDDYSINKTVSQGQVFTFPINGQYDFTFSYVNNHLKNPSTAGPGMTIFKIIGLALAGLSILAMGGYMLYTKKYAKRKTAKHFAE